MKMRKIFSILALALALVIFTSSCEADYPPVKNCVQVRMVANICGNAVLEVVDPKGYSMKLGSFEIFGEDGNSYTVNNTFFTFMPCYDDPTIYERGALFHVKILPEINYSDLGCVVCLATIANPPEESYGVQVVEDCTVVY